MCVREYECECVVCEFAPPLTASAPSVDVFECIISVSQMLVQGMWAKGSSPILQLPHITYSQLKHFRTKKVFLTGSYTS